MQVDIQIRGVRASGKTRLADQLAYFLKDKLADYPGKHTVEIKAGLVPDPRGLEMEVRFNVGA